MDFDINRLTTSGRLILILAIVADTNLVANIIAKRTLALNAFGAAILTVWTLWLFS